MVLDRWLFLRRHLPVVPNGTKRVLEIGCGSGAFTIGTALRGYQSLGLSWDKRNQEVAARRAAICGAVNAEFRVQDVRFLDDVSDLKGAFDVIICCETIEHIIDDGKLMRDIRACLKTGGKLLLTTPNVEFRPIGGDEGPFLPIEDGRHVRKGYSRPDLERLCSQSEFHPVEIGYCSGYLSQKGSIIHRELSRVHPLIGWAIMAPFRPFPPLLDGTLAGVSGWPGYSITMVATR
jgi:SAM-dependent methyltransferase